MLKVMLLGYAYILCVVQTYMQTDQLRSTDIHAVVDVSLRYCLSKLKARRMVLYRIIAYCKTKVFERPSTRPTNLYYQPPLRTYRTARSVADFYSGSVAIIIIIIMILSDIDTF